MVAFEQKRNVYRLLITVLRKYLQPQAHKMITTNGAKEVAKSVA